MISYSMPVMLTFDLDGEISTRVAVEMGKAGVTDPEIGKFGPTQGYKSILNVLAKHEVKAAFQVAGKIAEMYPKAIEEIYRAGHEIATHSYTHRDYRLLDEEELEEEVVKTIDALVNITGERPVGHRSPFWLINEKVFPILAKHGVLWNSDAHTSAETMGTIAPYIRPEANIWEIPSSICADDWGNLRINHLSSEALLALWLKQADKVYEQQRQLVIVCHPQVIGRPEHINILDKFIKELLTKKHCYFTKPMDFINSL